MPRTENAVARRGTLRRLAVASLLAATGLVAINGPWHSRAVAAVPSGYVDELVADGLPAPTSFAALPNGEFLVAQQNGILKLVRASGTVEAAPVADLAATTCTDAPERGLLAVAVDPAFASNRRIYTYRTFKPASGPCVERLSRWEMPAAAATNEFVLVDGIPNPNGNHNGGDIQFGKDGYLYLSVGDGGTGGAPAPLLNTLRGKVVRITTEGDVPSSNPHVSGGSSCRTGDVGASAKCQEIFEIGLRNPFRIAMDPNAAGTRYYINDVGQSAYEEIDYGGTAGANYGWPTREGYCASSDTAPGCTTEPNGARTNPIHAYGRTNGCTTITAGARQLNGTAGWTDGYYFADFGCDTIFLLNESVSPTTAMPWATGIADVTQMRFLGATLLYTTHSGGGQLRRIRAVANEPTTTTSSTTTTTSTTVVAPSTTAVPPGSPAAGRFVTVAPTRVLDTRSGIGGPSGLVTPGQSRRISLILDVPVDATAVALNVTMVDPAGPGWVRLWPAGTVEPETSTVNVNGAGENVANGAIVTLGANRQIDISTSVNTHVLVDLSGYWFRSAPGRGGRYIAFGPDRVLDERDPPGPPSDNGIRTIKMTGSGDPPRLPTAARAVAFTLTVVDAAEPGYATVWPTEAARPTPPNISVLNYGTRDVRANFVIMPLGEDGSISLFSSAQARYVIDVAGYITDESAPLSAAGMYVPVPSQRRVDTRTPLGASRLLPDAMVTLGMPPQIGGPVVASAVVTNLTATKTSGGGFVTAFRGAGTRPLASVLNFTSAGQDRAVLALTAVNEQNQASYVANVATDLVIDLTGYFTA